MGCEESSNPAPPCPAYHADGQEGGRKLLQLGPVKGDIGKLPYLRTWGALGLSAESTWCLRAVRYLKSISSVFVMIYGILLHLGLLETVWA